MRVPEAWHRANLAFLGTVEKVLEDKNLAPVTKMHYIEIALKDLKAVGEVARVREK